MTGRNVAEGTIKTYALDRMTDLVLTDRTFTPATDFDPDEYFRYSFGIVFSQGEPKRVVIRTDLRQAKYFRALPLHPSQSEMVSDTYSIFSFTLRLYARPRGRAAELRAEYHRALAPGAPRHDDAEPARIPVKLRINRTLPS